MCLFKYVITDVLIVSVFCYIYETKLFCENETHNISQPTTCHVGKQCEHMLNFKLGLQMLLKCIEVPGHKNPARLTAVEQSSICDNVYTTVFNEWSCRQRIHRTEIRLSAI